jgi:hypothetical protein
MHTQQITIEVDLPDEWEAESDKLRPAKHGEQYIDPSAIQCGVRVWTDARDSVFHYLILRPRWQPPKCMAAAAGVFRESHTWRVCENVAEWDEKDGWLTDGACVSCRAMCKIAGETFTPPHGDDVPDELTWTEIRKEGE